MRRQIDALGQLYSRVGRVITAASELDSIDGMAILGDARPDDVGIGVAQGPHPEIGEGAIWIVVFARAEAVTCSTSGAIHRVCSSLSSPSRVAA